MAKTKTPYFSFGAQGSVAGSITAQRRHYTTMLREKPLPTDPYSLPQAYQRWDYQDGIFYWQTLTPAQKQQFKTDASRYHMTGFAYFMRWYLKNLPDLVGRWHLDYISAGQTPDSSRNNNPANVFGPILAAATINGGFQFDGINDYIEPASQTLIQAMLAQPFSIVIYHNSVLPFAESYSTPFWNTSSPYSMQYNNGQIRLHCLFAINGPKVILTDANLAYIGSPLCLVYLWTGTFTEIWINGVRKAQSINLAGDTLTPNPGPLIFGRADRYPMRGTQDHLILYNRSITEPHIISHSERSYPS